MTVRAAAAAVALLATIGCAPRGPVVDTGARPVGVGGTIAGSVRSSGDAGPLSGRKVTAIDNATGGRFETTTGANGGYTLKVPSGTYRLEVELRAGEAFETRPDATDVGVGDIDSARDFVVTVRRTGAP
jgi:hypothetical protein